MARQTQAQREQAESERIAAEAAEIIANQEEGGAVEARVREHPNQSDAALTRVLTDSEIQVEELKKQIDELNAKLAAQQAADAPITDADGEEVSPSKAVTFWLADPTSDMRLYNEETKDYIQFHAGRYIATNQHEVDLIETHMAGTAYRQDRDTPIGPHPTSGYSPLSDAAYQAHVNLVTRA